MKNFKTLALLVTVAFSTATLTAQIKTVNASKSTITWVGKKVTGQHEGIIKLNNQEINVDGPLQAQKLGIAIIHQEMNLMPHLTVAQNILIGREPRKFFGIVCDDRELNRRAKILLDELNLPG